MANVSKRVYIKSFGCPTNLSDGEIITGCLSQAGFGISKETHSADILIYNTCAVKTPTENRIIDVLKKTPKDKRVIITGCLPLINFERIRNEVCFDGIVGPAPGAKIVEVVHRIEHGEKLVVLIKNSKPDLYLPRISRSSVTSIIPINYGCLGTCSYCCVRYARGHLRSYPLNEIAERVGQNLTSGTKEFWLTSQDTACYGKDCSTSLPDLINRICEIEGDFFVRVGMMTPNNALDMLVNLIDAYNDQKVFKFLHLPVQSGDDEVLRLMNRFYTSEDFKKIVNAFRTKIPKITIATDVICGFPGESKIAFNQTMKLIEEIKPDIVNISKFFPRPRTPAKRMKQLHPQEVKDRCKKVLALTRRLSFQKNKTWLGWAGIVLIDEKGKGNSWVGRNFAYKPMVVKSEEFLYRKFLKVRVINAFSTYLETEIIE